MSNKQAGNRTFWGEIAPSEHFVQIYDEDARFLDSLEEFVYDGLSAGEGVVVIATSTHLHFLEERLRNRGVSVNIARARDQYIPLDARESLEKFMVNGWPDDDLFLNFVSGVLHRARANGRPARAFGEMVALMWAQGQTGAVVRLEHLWHDLCHQEGFPLFCAYPKAGFTQDSEESIRLICDAHSRVIGEQAVQVA